MTTTTDRLRKALMAARHFVVNHAHDPDNHPQARDGSKSLLADIDYALSASEASPARDPASDAARGYPFDTSGYVHLTPISELSPSLDRQDRVSEEIVRSLREDAKFFRGDLGWEPQAQRLEQAAAALEAAFPTRADGWRLVPAEPTPEMLAATLPMAGAAMGCHMGDLRLAEKALGLLEPRGISNSDHQKGLNAALELLRDYRAMLAAAPPPPDRDRT